MFINIADIRFTDSNGMLLDSMDDITVSREGIYYTNDRLRFDDKMKRASLKRGKVTVAYYFHTQWDGIDSMTKQWTRHANGYSITAAA